MTELEIVDKDALSESLVANIDEIEHVPDTLQNELHSEKPTQETEIPKMNLAEFAVDKEFELAPDWTNKIVVAPSSGCDAEIELLNGTAEIFGFDLIPGEIHRFVYPQKAVVVSDVGGNVRIKAHADDHIQVIEGDLFSQRLAALYSRIRLQANHDIATQPKPHPVGNKILMVGPKDSGKSTCCSTLVNYGIRDGFYSILVDIDPGQQGISLPGILSAAIVRNGIHPTSGCQDLLLEHSLPFGHLSIGDDVELYKDLVKKLGDTVVEWQKLHHVLKVANVIINTAGWIEGAGFEVLCFALRIFEANLVVTLGSESLSHKWKELSATHQHLQRSVFIPSPQSTSVAAIEEGRLHRALSLRRAFFLHDILQKPVKCDLENLIVYQISSFRRIPTLKGAERVICNEVIRPGRNLLCKLLYISSTKNVVEDVKSAPVIGFATLVGFNNANSEAWIISTRNDIFSSPVVLIATQIEVPGLNGKNLLDSLEAADF